METSSSVSFLMKWGCRGHWGHWGCWGFWGHWGCWGSWYQGYHSVCKVHAVFLFLEAKEAVEVIEASDVIMSVEVIEATEVFRTTHSLKINSVKARITLLWCFEKKYFWTEWWNIKWNSAIIQDRGCGGQGCYFQPNPRVISQMSASHECTDTVFMT